jgi:hypothetical protein
VCRQPSRGTSFETPLSRLLSDEVISCGALSDPHSEEARERRLRTMLRIAGRTMEAPMLTPLVMPAFADEDSGVVV